MVTLSLARLFRARSLCRRGSPHPENARCWAIPRFITGAGVLLLAVVACSDSLAEKQREPLEERARLAEGTGSAETRAAPEQEVKRHATSSQPAVADQPAHILSLNAHGLESTRLQDLSSLLLNDPATGATVMDVRVANGTAEVSYLRITLIAPATASGTRTFSVKHDAVSIEDADDDCTASPGACATLPAPVLFSEFFPAMETPFEVRLYTADENGAPIAIHNPCSEPGCVNTPLSRTYRISPRTSATDIPRYVAMAWLKRVHALRPTNALYPVSPPFTEFDQAGHRYTGKQFDVDYCNRTATRGFPRVTYCTQRTHYKRRQAIEQAVINLGLIRFQFESAVIPSGTFYLSKTTEVLSVHYGTSEE